MDADAAHAYFLPPDLEDRISHWEEIELGGARLRAPRLAPPDLATIATGLARAGAELGPSLNAARVVESLGAVAAGWADHTEPGRQAAERLLPAITGYAPAMVAEALDLLIRSLQAEALDELLRAEAGHAMDRPPRLLLLIAAGTVFPPAIVGMTAALLLRSPVVIKPASGEPVLAALWARSLAARDPTLARLVAVLPWSRTHANLTAAALAAADCVLAHGDDETIAAICAAAPSGTQVIAHGHRVSAAIIGAQALAQDPAVLARSLARDLALYEQEGCLSPHTVFVEEASAVPARAFADLLAAELRTLARAWPRAPLTPSAVSSLRQFLLTAELEGRLVLGGLEEGWAIVMDSTPRFEFSPLRRTVIVKSVKSVAVAAEALVAVSHRLQAVALAVPLAERLHLARSLGLYDDVTSNPEWAPRVRLCPIGTMQSPPLTWAADGHRPLGALCRRERGGC